MSISRWSRRGFSLIEMLVVLTIVTILVVAGVAYMGDRNGAAVRSIMDELEGNLSLAQKGTIVTTKDVYVTTDGTWADGTLILDGRPLILPVPPATPPATPVVWPATGDLTPGDNSKRQGSDSEVFRADRRQRDYRSAGVDVNNTWYSIALGSCSSLATVAPINGQSSFVAALSNPLFTGTANSVVINGQTQRFTTGFCIVVVSITARPTGPVPVPNGPIGVIVVPQNSSTIYKFYKPDGANNSWRRA